MKSVLHGMPGLVRVTLPDGERIYVLRDVGEGDPLGLLQEMYRAAGMPVRIEPVGVARSEAPDGQSAAA